MALHLDILTESFAVCRLGPKDAIPAWAHRGEFVSISRTNEELSILCHADAVPVGVKSEKPWRAFKVRGPLDFSLIGILAGLATTLAQSKISLFAVSTFDTDYLLVRAGDFEAARAALKQAGHTLHET